MKSLRIVYGDLEIFSGEVAEFQLTENDGAISVKGLTRPATAGPNLLELLAASKKRQRAEA